MSFSNLGLSPKILQVLTENSYSEPSPIQSKSIPAILTGKDVIACAQTGTGKTAAFALPLIQKLVEERRHSSRPKTSVLILTPTRELASQVAESIATYSKYLPIQTSVIFGGVKIYPQIERLKKGLHILVATPGRLLDHIRQGTIDLSAINVLVLDEADRMLDMGFVRDVRKIISFLPKQRQNLLFSATFSREIKELASELLVSPITIEVARQNSAADLIDQVIHPVDRRRKRELLSFLIRSENWQQVLVFTRTKHGANRLAQQLEKDGISTAAIHGNKSQGARTRALEDFKKGNIRVLVATDIAARGLDISQLPHVINYDLPNVAEDYVHRIGRTGRAGSKGEARSLVCSDDHKLLNGIERLLNQRIPSVVIPNYEPAQHTEAPSSRPPMPARAKPNDGFKAQKRSYRPFYK